MIDRNSYYNRMRDADYDATLVGSGIQVPPSWELRPFFHSSSTRLNASSLNDPAVDALVEAALSTRHLDQFVSTCRALDRVLLWNYYQFPLDARGDTRIVYWDKFGRPDLPEEMYYSAVPGRLVVRRGQGSANHFQAESLTFPAARSRSSRCERASFVQTCS